MSTKSVFQKFDLDSGNVLIVKMVNVVEICKLDLDHWKESEKRFNENNEKYLLLDIDLQSRPHVVAGLIHAWDANEFEHYDVVKWAAFVGIDLTEHEVSNALQELKKNNASVDNVNSRNTWKVDNNALSRYLKVR